MLLPTQLVYDSASTQTITIEPAALGYSFSAVTSATATIYGTDGTSLATPTVVINAGSPIACSVQSVFDSTTYPLDRDYRLSLEIEGTLSNGDTEVQRIDLYFDVVRTPVEASITLYDLTAEDAEINYNHRINTEALAAPHVQSAFLRLYAKLRSVQVYPDLAVDRYLWRACLLYESLWGIFAAHGNEAKEKLYRQVADGAWRHLTGRLRQADEDDGSSLSTGMTSGRLVR